MESCETALDADKELQEDSANGEIVKEINTFYADWYQYQKESRRVRIEKWESDCADVAYHRARDGVSACRDTLTAMRDEKRDFETYYPKTLEAPQLCAAAVGAQFWSTFSFIVGGSCCGVCIVLFVLACVFSREVDDEDEENSNNNSTTVTS